MLIFVLGTFWVPATPVVHAKDLQEIFRPALDCMSTVIERRLIRPSVQRLSGEKILTFYPDREIEFGNWIAGGFTGDVYPIESGYEAHQPSWRGRRMVGKLAHRMKFPRGWVPQRFRRSLTFEQDVSALVNDLIPQIESRSEFPLDPAWEQGHLPITPILDVLKTEVGDVVIKPFMEGKRLREMLKKGGPGNFTPEQVESLRDIYKLSRAIEAVFPGLKVDYKADNLLWVDHPQLMRGLRLKRPSFVFFEFSFATFQVEPVHLPPLPSNP